MKGYSDFEELARFVISNGRVLPSDDGRHEWASLEVEIDFEATERGWAPEDVKAAIEWAYKNLPHNG